MNILHLLSLQLEQNKRNNYMTQEKSLSKLSKLVVVCSANDNLEVVVSLGGLGRYTTVDSG